MRTESTAAICLSAALFWTMAPATASATAICWVDRVEKAGGGLNVFFRREAILQIDVKESSGATHSYSALDGTVRDPSGHKQDHLFVKDGVEFSASQMAHDSCWYTVSGKEKVGQLTAKAAMNLPGLKPSVATQIIRTDGTTSN